MDTKLTLKLDTNIIERAKDYAKLKNVSLSQLVESYLNFVTSDISQPDEITPLVKSLSGSTPLSAQYDERKEYKKHILEKYKD